MNANQLILMVDDEPENLKILQQSLGNLYQFKEANSGEEALEILEHITPDIILLDVMMSGIDGYETCLKIREQEKFDLTKVIFVSGKGMPEERLKGYHVGGNDFVTKPFNPDEINAKVSVFLKLVATERELCALNISLKEEIRVRTEQMFLRERASFLGIHTAEIVHNLNNPLAILSGCLSKLSALYPQEQRIPKAQAALEKMHNIIKTILDSTRNNNDQFGEPINMNHILASELQLLEADQFFKYKVRLEKEFNEISPVIGHPSHLSQAFGNLIKNAIESMHEQNEKILRVSTQEQGDYVIVNIQDSGCGIPEENLSKIFDPFFTTKPAIAKSGEPTGTGLGLASVKRMLASYGAEMKVESKLQKGTCFTVMLRKHK